MTQGIPVEIRRRTLAGQIRYLADQVCAAVPDEAPRLGLCLALESAAERAETQQRQAEIHYREAADRERALAALQRVHAAVAALDAQLAREDTGERHVLEQIQQALAEES